MARTSLGLNALTEYQELLSVASTAQLVRSAVPLQSFVQEGTTMMQAGSSAEILAQLDEMFLDTDESATGDLLRSVQSRFREHLHPLLEVGEEQILILKKLLGDAEVGLDDLDTMLGAPLGRGVYEAQVAELVHPAVQAILDAVAMSTNRRVWSSASELFEHVVESVDDDWLAKVMGLPAVGDQRTVLNHAAETVFRRWLSGEGLLTNHCDRWMRIEPDLTAGAVVISPTRPVLAGQYQGSPESKHRADGPTGTVRLIPTSPTAFVIERHPLPRLAAIDIETGRVNASISIDGDTGVRRSHAAIVVTSGSSFVDLVGADDATIRRTRGSLIVEVDSSDNRALGAPLEGDIDLASVEESADHQLLAIFSEVNPVHAE